MNRIQEKFTSIANAIRTKTGSTEPIQCCDFEQAILSINTGGGATMLNYNECIQLTDILTLKYTEGENYAQWDINNDDIVDGGVYTMTEGMLTYPQNTIFFSTDLINKNFAIITKSFNNGEPTYITLCFNGVNAYMPLVINEAESGIEWTYWDYINSYGFDESEMEASYLELNIPFGNQLTIKNGVMFVDGSRSFGRGY